MSLKKSCAAFARPLVVAVLLIALGVPAWAQDEWTPIGKSNYGEYYLRRSSIEDNGSYITVWIKGVLSDAAKSEPVVQLLESLLGREISYSVILYGAKKGSRQIRQTQVVYYDENDYAFFSMNEHLAQQYGGYGAGEWIYCVPDSDEEMVWKAIMKAAKVRY